jgi:hypothetical protein
MAPAIMPSPAAIECTAPYASLKNSTCGNPPLVRITTNFTGGIIPATPNFQEQERKIADAMDASDTAPELFVVTKTADGRLEIQGYMEGVGQSVSTNASGVAFASLSGVVGKLPVPANRDDFLNLPIKTKRANAFLRKVAEAIKGGTPQPGFVFEVNVPVKDWEGFISQIISTSNAIPSIEAGETPKPVSERKISTLIKPMSHL